MALGAILGFLASPLKEVLETRKMKKAAQAEVMVELAKAEVRTKIAMAEAKAEIERKKATADVDWERIWATQAATSWKDEYWTIVLSLPVMAAFIPKLQPFVLEGFGIVAQMPQWYQMSLMGAIGAAFGLRALAKFKPLGGTNA